MRDIDDIQAHEAKQQHLVEDIVTALHQATRDDDRGYAATFRDLAICILHELDRRHQLSADYDRALLFAHIVKPRIEAFTNDDVERKYLFCKVFDQASVTATQHYRSAHLHQQIAAA